MTKTSTHWAHQACGLRASTPVPCPQVESLLSFPLWLPCPRSGRVVGCALPSQEDNLWRGRNCPELTSRSGCVSRPTACPWARPPACLHGPTGPTHRQHRRLQPRAERPEGLGSGGQACPREGVPGNSALEGTGEQGRGESPSPESGVFLPVLVKAGTSM